MQDFAKLYQRKHLPGKKTKLMQIRRLILSGLAPEIIVLLVAALVLPIRR